MSLDTLIFDRTAADVQRVRELRTKILTEGLGGLTNDERTEYMAGMKGAYNYTDFNRVENAKLLIADRMIELAYEVASDRDRYGVSRSPLTDVPYDPDDIEVSSKYWRVTDIPTQSTAATFLDGLALIRRQLPLPADTPLLPDTLGNLDYEKANDIERMLFVVSDTLEEVAEDVFSGITHTHIAFPYTGATFTGE